MSRAALLLPLLLLTSSVAHAEPIDVPFEPTVPPVVPVSPPEAPPIAPFREVATALVGRYQETAAPVSVARCPYALSCSALALRSLQQESFTVALIHFVDRFFFRENADAPSHYELRHQPGGRLLLDDEIR